VTTDTHPRLAPETRQSIRRRVAKLQRWIARENDWHAEIPEPLRDEAIHQMRLDWFQAEIDREQAKCPHPPVAQMQPGALFPEIGQPPPWCADCGKVLTIPVNRSA
jgi:hypothetical protein